MARRGVYIDGWRPRSPRLRALLAAAIAATTTVGLVASALIVGVGSTVTKLELSSGGVWLVSPDKGLVSLLDGPSEQIVASVRTFPRSAGLSVTQDGLSAFVADDTAGTVARIDGANYQIFAGVPFGGTGADLSVLVNGDAAVVVNAGARVATPVTRTLDHSTSYPLRAHTGPQQALFDKGGRLWTVDSGGGGLSWFDTTGGSGHAAAGPTDRLLAVGARTAIVDTGGSDPLVSWLKPNGERDPWPCRLPIQSGDSVHLLGSGGDRVVYAAVSETGTLVDAPASGARCDQVVTLTDRPADFGAMSQSGHYLFVYDKATGATHVVDTLSGRQVAVIPTSTEQHDVQLIAKDGLVFYNDLSGEKAGVFRQIGDQTWTAGEGVLKYNPDTGLPTVPVIVSPNGTSPASSEPSKTTNGKSTSRAQPSTSVSSSSASTTTSTTSRTTSPSSSSVGPTQFTPSVTQPTGFNSATRAASSSSSPARPAQSKASVTRPRSSSSSSSTSSKPVIPAPALTVSATGPGTVSVRTAAGAVNCTRQCAPIVAGDVVTITASPAGSLAAWTGPCVGQGAICSFPITGDSVVTATFAGFTASADLLDLTGPTTRSLNLTLKGGTGLETWTATSETNGISVSAGSGGFVGRSASVTVSVTDATAVPNGLNNGAVRLALKSPSGAALGTLAVDVKANAAPVVANAVCENTPDTLVTVQVADLDPGTGLTVTANFGAGPVDMSQTIASDWQVLSFLGPGTYPAIFTATDGLGAVGTLSRSLVCPP